MRRCHSWGEAMMVKVTVVAKCELWSCKLYIIHNTEEILYTTSHYTLALSRQVSRRKWFLMSASITSSIISSFYLHFPLDNWNNASHCVRIYNRHLVNWQKLLEKARQKEAKITSRNFDKTQTLCHDSCSSTAIIKYEFLMVIKENPIFESSETI